ncbi:hypothetical protein B0T19DRAFT_232848 [Cercophora scortea]|uniref:Uncharacterized protein n=1 Tax=Cercophora scortea TaxID=314031 RepID=A0AAE0IGN9_9PEZI|nr:hypothetical protein B0T19DRAFT_232848 [Cercophora scortea]
MERNSVDHTARLQNQYASHSMGQKRSARVEALQNEFLGAHAQDRESDRRPPNGDTPHHIKPATNRRNRGGRSPCPPDEMMPSAWAGCVHRPACNPSLVPRYQIPDLCGYSSPADPHSGTDCDGIDSRSKPVPRYTMQCPNVSGTASSHHLNFRLFLHKDGIHTAFVRVGRWTDHAIYLPLFAVGCFFLLIIHQDYDIYHPY